MNFDLNETSLNINIAYLCVIYLRIICYVLCVLCAVTVISYSNITVKSSTCIVILPFETKPLSALHTCTCSAD